MGAFWQLFSRNRSAVLGLGIIVAIILMAITAPLFFPGDPFGLAGKSMSPPGENGFLLGSDSLGRDVAAGIAHGAKTSLLIGLVATIVAVLIGVIMAHWRGIMAASSTTC